MAVQASRFSTFLHKTFEFGVLQKGTLRRSLNPIRAFFSKGNVLIFVKCAVNNAFTCVTILLTILFVNFRKNN